MKVLLLAVYITALSGSGVPGNGHSPEEDVLVSYSVTRALAVQDTGLILSRLRTEYFQAVNRKGSPRELIPIIKRILELDPGSSAFWFYLGEQQKIQFEYETAIEAFNKSLELYDRTSGRPMIQIYDYLGHCYHILEDYKQEMQVYDSGSVYYPGHPALVGRLAVCNYARGWVRKADSLLQEYQAYWQARGKTESDILYNLGVLFFNTDDRKAERYFRSALELDPENVEKQAGLAKLLISNGIFMEEAMKKLEFCLSREPDNPTILHLYGLGLFKMEEYEPARDYLARADSLYTDYNHNLKTYLEKVEEFLSIKVD